MSPGVVFAATALHTIDVMLDRGRRSQHVKQMLVYHLLHHCSHELEYKSVLKLQVQTEKGNEFCIRNWAYEILKTLLGRFVTANRLQTDCLQCFE